MKKIQLFFIIGFLALIANYSFACTIFTASSGETVLAGNNEDMCTTNTVLHILPPSSGKYGCAFWGFKGDGNYQGGMNEHGLFFDGASTPPVDMDTSALPEFDGMYIMQNILEECKTVEEAIDYFKKFSHPYLKFSHVLVADATGDAAIFEWGGQKLNFIRKGDENFLIATNFNFAETASPEKECNRYATAKRMLSENKPSLSLFEEILSLTHAEGTFPTVYSTLCDLKNGKLYLYNFHNYTFKKEFDLEEEFKKGEQMYMFRSFFPESNAELLFRYMNDCIDNWEDLPQHAVTFTVNNENPLEETGTIFLRGSAKELGDWNETGIKLEKQSDNVYTKTISFKEGKLFGFSLATENAGWTPKDYNNQIVGEGVIDVKSDTTIILNVTQWENNK